MARRRKRSRERRQARRRREQQRNGFDELRRLPKEARMSTLEIIGDDLPDGAYWGIAAELGLEPDDFF